MTFDRALIKSQALIERAIVAPPEPPLPPQPMPQPPMPDPLPPSPMPDPYPPQIPVPGVPAPEELPEPIRDSSSFISALYF